MGEAQLRHYEWRMTSERFLWIAGLLLVGMLAGCSGEDTTGGAPVAVDTPPPNEAAGSAPVGEDASSESLGSIEVAINGEPRRFEIRSGSDTSLVPVMGVMRMEGRADGGETFQVMVKPAELDKLQYPVTLKGQTAADLEPGQRVSSLRMVMVIYSDGQGQEYTSTTAHEVHLESWNQRTIIGSFPGADLGSTKGGSVKASQGRFEATFPH